MTAGPASSSSATPDHPVTPRQVVSVASPSRSGPNRRSPCHMKGLRKVSRLSTKACATAPKSGDAVIASASSARVSGAFAAAARTSSRSAGHRSAGTP